MAIRAALSEHNLVAVYVANLDCPIRSNVGFMPSAPVRRNARQTLHVCRAVVLWRVHAAIRSLAVGIKRHARELVLNAVQGVLNLLTCFVVTRCRGKRRESPKNLCEPDSLGRRSHALFIHSTEYSTQGMASGNHRLRSGSRADVKGRQLPRSAWLGRQWGPHLKWGDRDPAAHLEACWVPHSDAEGFAGPRRHS